MLKTLRRLDEGCTLISFIFTLHGCKYAAYLPRFLIYIHAHDASYGVALEPGCKNRTEQGGKKQEVRMRHGLKQGVGSRSEI